MKKKTAPKRVSRLRKSSRPVLTSPWKIGLFVSLLLVLVGIGVGYYFVDTYGVNLAWLEIRPEMGLRGFQIDSFGFFREMYPLVACVTLVSLTAYFIVASAVRRYRCYLDSGQDYRKMVSLAESIDDLTNPAQIARLASYPELQAVLRSYGDQIREISQDIGERQESTCCDDIDADADALLRDDAVPGQALGSKPYAAAFRRIQERLHADRAKMDELATRCDAERRALSGAALAYGRVMEAAGGAGEDLTEIARMAGELGRIACEIETSAPADASPPQTPETAADIEGAARKLEDGSRLLQELSEENNGVAISLALMAARAPVDEHELAAHAERIRMAAERFHKLSATVAAIAKGLLDASYALKEQPGGAVPAAGSASKNADAMKIQRIARAFENRSAKLQERICCIVSDLNDVQDRLQHEISGRTAEPAEAPADGEPVCAAPREDSQEGASSLRIDRGSAWTGMPESGETPGGNGDEGPPEESPGFAETASSDAPESSGRPGDFSDMSSLRNLDAKAEREESEPPAEAAERDDGAWMEMPGHRWRKVQVEKDETEDAGDVAVTVEQPAAPPNGPRHPEEDAKAAGRTEQSESAHGIEHEKKCAAAADSEDAEPVYDLSELGAVEYAAEVEAER